MLKQPFGIFDEYGRRLASPREAEEASLIFVVEGGQWYWPPMRKGFVRKLHGTNLSLETLSVQPVIFRIEVVTPPSKTPPPPNTSGDAGRSSRESGVNLPT